MIGQLLYGLILFLLFDSLGNGAYQIAILSLLVTMLIGLWLVWPVSDEWAGSGETPGEGGADSGGGAAGPGGPGARVEAPPARLAPDRAPLEPRG